MVASNMSLMLKCCTIGVLVTSYADNYGMLCKWRVQTFVEVTKRNGTSCTLLANQANASRHQGTTLADC